MGSIILPGFLIFIIIFNFAIPMMITAYYSGKMDSRETILNQKARGIILVDRNNQKYYSFGTAPESKFVSLSQISPVFQQAIIANEDAHFYQHHGISYQGILRSILLNIRYRKVFAGGSTITQQLVKNTILNNEKTLFRKYLEMVLAKNIEKKFTKNEILEMYLNTIYFGEGAYGIENAAKIYFNKSASSLNLAESSLLVGLLTSPSTLSPLSNDQSVSKPYQEHVLNRMISTGYISNNDKLQALDESLTYATHTPRDLIAPHFILMVKDELSQKYGESALSTAGFTVKTTLNLDWQKYTEDQVKQGISRLRRNQVTNGAAVILDPKTGELLTLVGSHDWNDETNGKINMALSPRQPGSAFKPFVYALAFQNGIITPASILDDKPATFSGNYHPHDYDYQYRGSVLARRALANSLNIPTIHVINRLGVGSVLSFAKELGMATLGKESDYGLSLALGSGEVSLLDLTSAYSVFANNGTRVTPTTILSISDKNNNVIYSTTPDTQKIIDEPVVYLISNILSDKNTRREEFGNLLDTDINAAVKTGTSENYRDSLTVGYTPSLVVGVWVGNNNNAPMDNIAGSLGAAPIWKSLIEQFGPQMGPVSFTQPSGITEELVCKSNGLKSPIATSSAIKEYFISGTEPTQNCFSFPSNNNQLSSYQFITPN